MASKELGVMTSQVKEDINVLIGSGLQVLNVPQDCLCSNCGMLAVVHFTNSCSHIYCRTCYLALKLEKRICRKCRTPIDGKTVDNDSVDLVIANLKAECTKKNLGCNDVIALRDLLEHTENCEFSKMRFGTEEYSKMTIADLKNTFDAELQKMANEFTTKLEETTTALKDQFEATTNMFSKKLSEMVELCKTNDTNVQQRLETVEASLLNLQRDISCGNQRTEQLKKFVTDHENNLACRQSGQLKETCDKVDSALLDIKSVDAVFLQRTDWFDNERNKRNETVDQLVVAVDEMKSAITKLTHEKSVITGKITGVKRTLATAQEKIDSPVDCVLKKDLPPVQQTQAQLMNSRTRRMRGAHNGTITWKIEEFSKNKKLKSTLYSEYFYLNEYVFRIRAKLQFHKTCIGMGLCFDLIEQENQLSPIFHYKRSYSILDQSDRREKIHISRTHEPNFRDTKHYERTKESVDYPEFCSFALLEKFKSVYLKNDQLVFRIVVDPVLNRMLEPSSRKGVLIWRVSKYQKTKQESLNDICHEVWSESFYSSEFGYRMRTSVKFFDDAMVVGLKCLVGQFDDALPNIFAHKVTVSILDQNDHGGGNCLCKVVRLDPKEIGKEEAKRKMSFNYCHLVFFQNDDFERIPYLVNDSILIRVVVEPI